MSSLDDPVAADTCAGGRKTTELGPVAESYDQLHRIDLLGEARAARGVPEGTYDSTVCAEIGRAHV